MKKATSKAVSKKPATKQTAATPRPGAARKRGVGHSNGSLSATTKEAIIVAALTAFGRDGFDGASLPKIARMAKVGHPLILYYFGSKDQLWRETIEYTMGNLRREADVLATACKTLPPLDRLRILMQSFCHTTATRPDHMGIIVAEARAKSERWTWLQNNYGNSFIDDLGSILREAQAAGAIRKVPLEELSFVLMGAVLVYFSINQNLPQDVALEKQAENFATLLLDIVINGVGLKART